MAHGYLARAHSPPSTPALERCSAPSCSAAASRPQVARAPRGCRGAGARWPLRSQGMRHALRATASPHALDGRASERFNRRFWQLLAPRLLSKVQGSKSVATSLIGCATRACCIIYSSTGFRSNESLVYGTSWLRGRSSPVALKSANWSSFKQAKTLPQCLLGRNSAGTPRPRQSQPTLRIR
jgi:hypothetical protein